MRTPVPSVDLRPDHWAIVRGALRLHVPDREVLAFGSRATWTAKDYSDLDLAVMGEEPLSLRTVSALDEALGDSDLPFKVDVVDWARIDDAFRRIIRRHGVPVQAPNLSPEVSGHARPRSMANIAKAHARHDLKKRNAGLFTPMFPDHWLRRPLYSLATWVNGLAFRKILFSQAGRPIIKIAELKGGISRQTKFTEQTFDDSVRVRPGDLLFSWSGSPETSIDAFWWRGPEGWLNQHVFRVTPQPGLDTTFFFYLLRYLKPNFIGIARNKQTTGLGHVTKRDLKNLRVARPDLSEQRAIAHILGTLDDKIELNRRMNETLEAMARALFKSWFVDFDPVRAKMEGRDPGLPEDIADLFPDRLVDSQMGKIPEGWAASEIGKEVSPVGGSTPSTKEPSYWHHGQHHWATPKDLSKLWSPVLLQTSRTITNAGLARIGSGLLPVGTVLMSSRAPIGYLAICEVPTAVNQGFVAMKCNQRLPNLYVLFWCCHNLGYIRNIAGGSTFAEISKKAFRSVPVLVPPEALLGLYERLCRPLYNQIVARMKEATTLAILRNTLLPKLMSGEIQLAATTMAMET